MKKFRSNGHVFVTQEKYSGKNYKLKCENCALHIYAKPKMVRSYLGKSPLHHDIDRVVENNPCKNVPLS